MLQLGWLWPCLKILRPDWKGFPRANPLAYWASSSVTKKKWFITLTTGCLFPDDDPTTMDPPVRLDSFKSYNNNACLLECKARCIFTKTLYTPVINSKTQSACKCLSLLSLSSICRGGKEPSALNPPRNV